MNFLIVETLAETVGTRWRELQKEKTASGGEFFVAAPLSSTPLPIFRWIIDNASAFPAWERVRFVLMDEQVEGAEPPYRYIDVSDPASYEGFARTHLLDLLERVTGVAIPVIRPDLDKLDAFTTALDLLVLAIGPNGNYANVMPGTSIETGWHVSHLEPDFCQVHISAGSESYAGATFREYGMSLGPQQVLSAGEIMVIASGSKKSGLVQQLDKLQHPDARFPISIIRHPVAKPKASVIVTSDTMQGSDSVTKGS